MSISGDEASKATTKMEIARVETEQQRQQMTEEPSSDDASDSEEQLARGASNESLEEFEHESPPARLSIPPSKLDALFGGIA